TLELPDGTLFTGQAMCAEVRQEIGRMGVDYAIGGIGKHLLDPVGWTMELRGIGDLFFESPTEYRHKVEKTQSAIEWACDWCGSINPRERRKCESCGGTRSFVYSE
ncbi:unnamed protein product, partial [marine sediment metagenome]